MTRRFISSIPPVRGSELRKRLKCFVLERRFPCKPMKEVFLKVTQDGLKNFDLSTKRFITFF